MFFVERMQLLNRTLKVFDEVFSTYVQQYIGLRNVILFQCSSVDVPATSVNFLFLDCHWKFPRISFDP